MSSLRSQAVSGVKWTGASTLIVSLVEFVRIAVLARLLNPVDFGLMSMIMVVIGFSHAFVDMGISGAIIYRQDSTRGQLSSLYWFNIFAGIVVFGMVLLLSPFVIIFYGEPRLGPLMFWASLSFLIIPIGQQFKALLQKELRFKTLTKIEIISSICGMVAAISAALQHRGAFSLIWGFITMLAFRSLILAGIGWINWRPALHFRFSDLKGYIGFGLYQTAGQSVNFFTANIDYLFIGRFLGPKILGVYTLAYNLVIMPLMRINPILTQVAFPVFSKKQKDNQALRRGYLEMIKLLSYVIFPILIGAAVIAPVFVPLVLGSGWETSIPLIQILALVGIMKALGNPLGAILPAKGRVDITFKFNCIVALINTLVFWFAAQRGVFVVAWSWVGLCVLYSVSYWWILYKVIELGGMEYISALARPATITILMGCFLYAVYSPLSTFAYDNLFSLLSLVALGVIIYGLLLLLLDQVYVRNLWNLIYKKKLETA